MARATFALEGDLKARAILKAIGPAIRRKVLEPALRKAMEPVLARAVLDAPRDTGNLAEHITLTLRVDRRGRIVVDVGIRGVPYAAAEEFGAHGHPAEHYMLRALDEEGPGAKDAAIREILSGLERELR